MAFDDHMGAHVALAQRCGVFYQPRLPVAPTGRGMTPQGYVV
ncbi:hypothetical protein [Brevundimonas variabilis]|nr:hypothetical protein [Brevundimonas variabilis]